jgi:hypothetical protein
MITASHTTATVVETNVQAPLQAHLDDVSSRYISLVARIKIIFSKFYDRAVPFGYEDQSGFHFGEQSSPNDSGIESRSR